MSSTTNGLPKPKNLDAMKRDPSSIQVEKIAVREKIMRDDKTARLRKLRLEQAAAGVAVPAVK